MLVLAAAPSVAQPAASDPEGQLAHGDDVYLDNCAACHGPGLDNGTFAPPLKGAAFRKRWQGQNAAAILSFIQARMPPGAAAGQLPDDDYLAVLAMILRRDGRTLGPDVLDAQSAQLQSIIIPPP